MDEKWPVLQVALDLIDLDKAVSIAKESLDAGADWIEVGTPLIKMAGMQAISRMRSEFPSATIYADLKTLDTGFLEVEIAAKAGADIVGIAGVAQDSTIKGAVDAARKHSVKVIADLICTKNPILRAKELEALGVDFVEYHVSVDAQMSGEKIPFQDVERIVHSIGIPVAVAGGLDSQTAKKAIMSGAKIAVVGGSITKAASPGEAAKEIKQSISGIC